jgi:hypothetical protein
MRQLLVFSRLSLPLWGFAFHLFEQEDGEGTSWIFQHISLRRCDIPTVEAILREK